VSEPSKERPFVEVSAFHPYTPSIEEMQDTYRRAFKAASGHIVIAPIKDSAEGGHQSCSDFSLELLLEAIDEAKENNRNLTAVTIAAREYNDKDLAGRIEDLQALRKSLAADSTMSKERGRFHPPNGRQVPGRAGIHFLTNSPFNLQAGRIIVPMSVAKSKGYDHVSEEMVAELPKIDSGRLIALDDRRLDQINGGNPEKIQERFSKLLANMVGTVVIYLPSADDDQLKEMMSAVLDACDKNPKLSVNFAAPDKAQQAQLTRAYRDAKVDRHENSFETDDDDDSEISIAELWQTV
jgi:hypothetical protein